MTNDLETIKRLEELIGEKLKKGSEDWFEKKRGTYYAVDPEGHVTVLSLWEVFGESESSSEPPPAAPR